MEAIRAGFAGQASTSAKILTAILRTNENLDAFSRNVNRMMLQISDSIDRLTRGMTAASDRFHGAMLEQGRPIEENNRPIKEQGARMEAMNRRIDENTAAIRENTKALLQIVDTIRGSSGDGQPRTGI